MLNMHVEKVFYFKILEISDFTSIILVKHVDHREMGELQSKEKSTFNRYEKNCY